MTAVDLTGLGIRRNSLQDCKYWNSLLEDTERSPSPKIFQKQLKSSENKVDISCSIMMKEVGLDVLQ